MPRMPCRLSRVAWLLAGVIVCLARSGLAENLIKDPSFENTKPRDRWGLVFKDWGGWVYSQPASFQVGKVARTGNRSCEMVGGRGAKIRIQSKKLTLPAGRYRVRAYLRGLDVGPGQWNRPNDFTVDLKTWFDLKKSGTFGWTPVTYVFDVPAGRKKPYQVFFGLMATGRVWVDDVSLEKVDQTVAVTAEPAWGKAESPVAPPGEIKTLLRCPTCGYRNDRSWKRCYACGQPLAAGAKRVLSSPRVKVIADFEDGKRAPFSAGQAVAELATSGKMALRLDAGYSAMDGRQDWSEHDFLHFDVFNPQPKSARLYVEVRDEATKGYWTRVNLNTVAPPGRSTVTIPTQLYVGEKSRPGRPLIRSAVTRFVVSVGKDGPVFLDHFRLERLDLDAVRFDELIALDFGVGGSPLMEGFAAADESTLYTPGRGFGWQAARLWRSFDARQPEALTQDFLCPEAGAFRFDLPNGKYRVMMIVDSPGGYWGEVQRYRQRTILLNGKPALEETVDLAAFRKRYFRHAHAEDLPGVDAFARYVLPVLKWRRFDAEVIDGKLEIGFRGANWAICLSAMVVYPLQQAEKGGRFVAWAEQRRRLHFENYFKQVVPAARGGPAPRKRCVLFARHFMDPPGAKDGPAEGEVLDEAKGLALTAARGETAAVTFSLQPPPAGVGAIDVTVSAPAGADGAALPASTVRPGWLDYRISRVTMDGGVWTVRPRYWRPAPAPAAKGVTRTFWLEVKVPADAAAGRYAAKVTVRPAGAAARSFPLRITVLPFKLDAIRDVAVGPWGSSIDLPWYGQDEQTQQWHWRMYERSLEAMRAAGCTSFSGIPHLRVSAAKGKVTLDAARADREMALARARGFTHLVSNYGAGSVLGYRAYGDAGGPDLAAAKRAGFADMKSFLAAVYGAIDRHAAERNWLPVAWNLCDEPLGANIPPAVKNALAHRQVAPALKHSFFMGATSMRGDDPKDPHYELVRALPIASLNLHDDKSLAVIRKAGNGFSFYNGGNRWTYGRYMKMLVLKGDLKLRLSWHWNIVAGDPYYALDCREDDYCWYNTDETGRLVPSLRFLAQIRPGLYDYRYLSTLQRLLKENPGHPAAARARKVFEEMMDLTAGKDRPAFRHRAAGRLGEYEADRQKVTSAILALLAPAGG